MGVLAWLGAGANAVQKGENSQEALRHFPKDGLIVHEGEGFEANSGHVEI